MENRDNPLNSILPVTWDLIETRYQKTLVSDFEEGILKDFFFLDQPLWKDAMRNEINWFIIHKEGSSYTFEGGPCIQSLR